MINSALGVGAIAIAAVLTTLSFGSIAAFVIIVVANRADPDPSGRRPTSVYLFGASFVTLWIAAIGIIAAAYSLIALIGTSYSSSYFSSEIHPADDAAARGFSIGAILFVVAGSVHFFHRIRGGQLSALDDSASSPTKRIERSYISVVCFISILVMVLATFAAIYTVFQLIAPGVYQLSSRTTGWKMLLDEATVLIVFGGIFWIHQRQTNSGLRLFPRAEKTSSDSAPMSAS